MVMLQTNSQAQPNRVPISVITGFLGSGKTTLLNHLVKQPGMESVALIINEFGEIGLDNLLVETSIENTLLLENGCICCSIRGDLVDTIGDLFAKAQNGDIPQFTRIVIETTGLADPAPIVNTIQGTSGLTNRCRLDGVVTLVDGVQGEHQARANPEAMMQIAQADLALITKSDLVSPQKGKSVSDFVTTVNPAIEAVPIAFGRIDPEILFELDRVESLSAVPHGDSHGHAEEHAHGHGHVHQHGDIATWSFSGDAPLDHARLMSWLTMLYSLRAPAMLRLKGLVRIAGEDRPLLVQAVGPLLSPLKTLDGWPDGQARTRLVFIVKGLSVSALAASFARHVVS